MTPEQAAQVTRQTPFSDLVSVVDTAVKVAVVAAGDPVHSDRETGSPHLARLSTTLESYPSLLDAAAQGQDDIASVVYATMSLLIRETSSSPTIQSHAADALAELALDLGGSGAFSDSDVITSLNGYAPCAASEVCIELFQVMKSMVMAMIEKHKDESNTDPYNNHFSIAAARPLDRIRHLYYLAEEASSERTSLRGRPGPRFTRHMADRRAQRLPSPSRRGGTRSTRKVSPLPRWLSVSGPPATCR